jgi:hypothetical protein
MIRTVAVDWSGALQGEQRKIWLAEAVGGRLVRLEAGRNREEVIQELVELRRRSPDLVVGLDFAFSFPAWFVRQKRCASAGAMWEVAAREGEQWLGRCEPPFWGRPGRTCQVPDERRYRRTDVRIRVRGVHPKSVFQVGGAGAVGTGSIRGMPFLTRLREGGFTIWPFDGASAAQVVEIFPRLLTGPVTKSKLDARQCYLLGYQKELHGRFSIGDPLIESATSSEDAFDAAVSAVRMALNADVLRGLRRVTDPVELLEGRIWSPPGGSESGDSGDSEST